MANKISLREYLREYQLEESQGVSIRNNTEVSNINKGICAKGDG
jgi:hypothetical protein